MTAGDVISTIGKCMAWFYLLTIIIVSGIGVYMIITNWSTVSASTVFGVFGPIMLVLLVLSGMVYWGQELFEENHNPFIDMWREMMKKRKENKI